MERNRPDKADTELSAAIELTPELMSELLRATIASHDPYRRNERGYVTRPITSKDRAEAIERLQIQAYGKCGPRYAANFAYVVGRPTVLEVDENYDSMAPLEQYRCIMTPERTVLAIEQLAIYNGAVFQPETAATIGVLLGRPTVVPVQGEMPNGWKGYPLVPSVPLVGEPAIPQHGSEKRIAQKLLARMGAYIISRVEKLFGVYQ